MKAAGPDQQNGPKGHEPVDVRDAVCRRLTFCQRSTNANKNENAQHGEVCSADLQYGRSCHPGYTDYQRNRGEASRQGEQKHAAKNGEDGAQRTQGRVTNSPSAPLFEAVVASMAACAAVDERMRGDSAWCLGFGVLVID